MTAHAHLEEGQDSGASALPTGLSPLRDEAASASSPEASIPSREWVAGSFEVATFAGEGKPPAILPIAGWIKHPFALDFRVFDDDAEWIDAGWYLTHIPTGFGIGGIIANLPEAKIVADEIREIADWSFTETDGAKTVAPAFVEFRAKCETKIVRGGPIAGPLAGMVSA